MGANILVPKDVETGDYGKMSAADPAPPVQTPTAPKSRNLLEIDLGPAALETLTAGCLPHLKERVTAFVLQVLKEARFVEEAEHAGSGAPEITAVHIDEAWWVTRRRVRHARYPLVRAGARAVQVFAGAGFGVGATHLQQTWGPALFVASALALLGAILLEGHLSRQD